MSNFQIGYEHSFGKQKQKSLENMVHPSPKRLKFSQATNPKPEDDIFFTLNFNGRHDRHDGSTSSAKNATKGKILFTSNQTTDKKEPADKYSEIWTPPFQERFDFSNQTTRPQSFDRFFLETTSTARNQGDMTLSNISKRKNPRLEEVLAPNDGLESGMGDIGEIWSHNPEKNLQTTKIVKQKQASDLSKTYKRKPSTKARAQPRQKSKKGKNTSNSRKKILKPGQEDIEDDVRGQRGRLTKDRVLVKDYGLEGIFPFRSFNSLQSECFDTLWNTTKNMIISAPTGSGKTVLFEIAIARNVIKEEFRGQYNFKVVYIAPIKALCQQKFSEWEQKFSTLGLKMLELTGDTEITEFAQYESSNIIITTPEKWDSITRKWKDNYRMVSQISLVLIDEVHLLNTEERGATLEAVVSRMKIISKSEELKDCPASQLRIIAVSATIPNIVDLGEWLEVPPECVKEFGDEYRSTPIEKHVFGYNMPKNEFQFEKSLNYRLMEIMRKFSSGKPTLVFCQTQKGTVSACEQIITDMRTREFIKDELQLQKLIESSHSVSDKNLQRFITHGVAFHNAGMLYEDRRIVEDLFIENLVTVICTTSTLAMGVNLPARLVIIKSTLCYRGAGVGYSEYSPIEIEQMMGRAGRPQFDTHGVVVIMTERKNVEKYKSQYILKDNLESHFFEQLAEHINAEISLRSIKSLDTVISYLKSTFFHIRLRKNPVKYGINDGFSNPGAINDYLATISKNVIQELDKYEMIQYFANDGKVRPLELGIDMSRYYVSFISMKNLFEKHAKQDFKDLLNTLSESQEFEKFRSRQEERRSLSNLNTLIRFPLTGAISSSSKKVYVLIQCSLGNVTIDNWELKRQTNEIMNTSWKIMHCFKRFYSIKKLGEGLIHSIKLIKFISMRTWEDNNVTLLKQLPGIGDKFASALCEANLDSFEKLLQAPPYLIEMACNKNPPFGVQTQKKVELIPQLKVQLLQRSPQEIKFRVALAEHANNKTDKSDSRSGFYYILEDKSNKIEAFRYISLDEGLRGGVSQVLSISNLKDLASPLYAHFINERYVGVDFCYTINEDGTCLCGEGENVQEKVIPEELYDSGVKKNNKDQQLNLENLPRVNNTTAQTCSHSLRCKNKKQCKHVCCKVGLDDEVQSNLSNIFTYRALRPEQPDRDVIDENIEYINAMLETAGKGDIKAGLDLNPLEKYSPIFRKNAYQKEAVNNGNKKMHQANLFSYMPQLQKKNDGFTAPGIFRDEQFRVEEREPIQDEPSGYCASLLEKLGFSGMQNNNSGTKGGAAKYKTDPHEQFQQLFGNIFE